MQRMQWIKTDRQIDRALHPHPLDAGLVAGCRFCPAPAMSRLGLALMSWHLGTCRSAAVSLNLLPQCGQSMRLGSGADAMGAPPKAVTAACNIHPLHLIKSKRKETKRKDYAFKGKKFRHRFNEKPRIIPGCPHCISYVCIHSRIHLRTHSHTHSFDRKRNNPSHSSGSGTCTCLVFQNRSLYLPANIMGSPDENKRQFALTSTFNTMVIRCARPFPAIQIGNSMSAADHHHVGSYRICTRKVSYSGCSNSHDC